MTEKYRMTELSLIEIAQREMIKKFAVAAGIVREGKLLFVRRIPSDFLGGLYELPGGGVNEGESLQQALVREVKEEVGLGVRNVIGMFDGFDYGDENKDKTRQFNFAVEVTDQEVRLNPNEHDEAVWVDEKSLENLPLTEEMRNCAVSFFTRFRRS